MLEASQTVAVYSEEKDRSADAPGPEAWTGLLAEPLSRGPALVGGVDRPAQCSGAIVEAAGTRGRGGRRKPAPSWFSPCSWSLTVNKRKRSPSCAGAGVQGLLFSRKAGWGAGPSSQKQCPSWKEQHVAGTEVPPGRGDWVEPGQGYPSMWCGQEGRGVVRPGFILDVFRSWGSRRGLRNPRTKVMPDLGQRRLGLLLWREDRGCPGPRGVGGAPLSAPG